MKKFTYNAIGGHVIEFNTIPIEDCERFFYVLSKNDDPLSEEFVFNLITENKYDINDLPAGLVLSVLYTAFKVSGVMSTPETAPNAIEDARKNIDGNLYSLFYTMIMRFMPKYSIDELKNKSFNEIIELFVYAEKIAERPLIDTDKMREVLGSTSTSKPVKQRGLKGTTKEEISAIKAALDNLPEGPDGFM